MPATRATSARVSAGDRAGIHHTGVPAVRASGGRARAALASLGRLRHTCGRPTSTPSRTSAPAARASTVQPARPTMASTMAEVPRASLSRRRPVDVRETVGHKAGRRVRQARRPRMRKAPEASYTRRRSSRAPRPRARLVCRARTLCGLGARTAAHPPAARRTARESARRKQSLLSRKLDEDEVGTARD